MCYYILEQRFMKICIIELFRHKLCVSDNEKLFVLIYGVGGGGGVNLAG